MSSITNLNVDVFCSLHSLLHLRAELRSRSPPRTSLARYWTARQNSARHRARTRHKRGSFHAISRTVRRVQWWGSLDEQPLPASSLNRNTRNTAAAATNPICAGAGSGERHAEVERTRAFDEGPVQQVHHTQAARQDGRRFPPFIVVLRANPGCGFPAVGGGGDPGLEPRSPP